MCKVLRAVECPLLAYNDLQEGFEKLYCIVNQGRQRNRGFQGDKIRGMSMPLCPLQSIAFLCQTR